MPSFTDKGKQEIQAILDAFSKDKPGSIFTLGTANKVLFTARAGKVDILDTSADAKLLNDEIMWFASTTKLLTSIAALQLVDRGVFTLDTPASNYLSELKTPLTLIDSIDSATGEPKFSTTDTEITILSLMNQTCGFGSEPGPLVAGWKAWSKVGKGFVNSCKRENLVNTPPVNPAGKTYEYGNGAEWLGLLIQEATGISLERYFQENLFGPLKMTSTSFIPFNDSPLASRVMPLRWLEASPSCSIHFEELTDQCPLLTLPRSTAEIEIFAAGGGIFTTATDYLLLLQHLLQHLQHPDLTSPILSSNSLKSLFERSLPGHTLPALHEMISSKFGGEVGDLDWSTGQCLWLGKGQMQGWGRYPGSGGWMGAPGVEAWTDPKAGIACVLGTNLLPFAAPEVNKLKEDLEKALYANLILD